jgi:hypothetical protein
MNRPLILLSHLLPVKDREAVLGDLVEAGFTPFQAILDLAGLILRRTLDPYRDWRTWICLGSAPLITPLLVGLSVALWSQMDKFATHRTTSLSSLVEIMRLSGLLLVASTTSCVAAFRLGVNTPVVLALTTLSPAVFCFTRYPATILPSCCVFLFLLPSCGAWLALRRLQSSRTWARFAVLLLLVLSSPFSVDHRGSLFNLVLLSVPAVYCLFSLPKAVHHAS